MRKILTIILTAFTVLCLGLAVGCSDKPCTSHTYNDSGKCTNCGHVCSHAEWTDGVCDECDLICGHEGGTATCIAKKECTVCGEEYDDLDLTNHAQSATWIKDADSHRQYYPCCNTDIVAESEHTWVDGVCSVDGCDYVCEHTGGTATCTAKKECSECGEQYGEVDLTNHTQSATWIKDADSHRQYYPCCNTDIVAESEHTWVDGVCSVDGCDYACEHTGGTATCIAKKECSECGEQYGEFDLTNHAQSATWTKDAGGHRQYYPCCDTDIIAQTAHVFNNGVCAESGCEYACLHESYTDGDCDACDVTCAHDSWTDGVCDECEFECEHAEYENCACKECGKEKAHEYNATGLCSVCGIPEKPIVIANDKAHYSVETIEVEGEEVQHVVVNQTNGWMTTTYGKQDKYLIFDLYINSASNAWTDKHSDADSGLSFAFEWKKDDGSLGGYRANETKVYLSDGTLGTKRTDDRSAYWLLNEKTWYTVVVELNGVLPETVDARYLTIYPCAISATSADFYMKDLRFTESIGLDISVNKNSSNVNTNKLSTTFSNQTGINWQCVINTADTGEGRRIAFNGAVIGETIEFKFRLSNVVKEGAEQTTATIWFWEQNWGSNTYNWEVINSNGETVFTNATATVNVGEWYTIKMTMLIDGKSPAMCCISQANPGNSSGVVDITGLKVYTVA